MCLFSIDTLACCVKVRVSAWRAQTHFGAKLECVSRYSIAQRRQLTVLGLALCLLAALFAIEAKLTWYQFGGNAPTHISSSKLQTADAPRRVAQAIASWKPLVHLPEVATILALVLMIAALRFAPPAQPEPVRFVIAQFSPHLFFRPPPTR